MLVAVKIQRSQHSISLWLVNESSPVEVWLCSYIRMKWNVEQFLCKWIKTGFCFPTVTCQILAQDVFGPDFMQIETGQRRNTPTSIVPPAGASLCFELFYTFWFLTQVIQCNISSSKYFLFSSALCYELVV